MLDFSRFEVVIPTVVPGRILAKVTVCEVCHTDIHAVNSDWRVVLHID